MHGMKTIHINLYGNEASPEDVPCLSLIWHRNEYQTYLYSAELTLKEKPTVPVVEIIVKQRGTFLIEEERVAKSGPRKGQLIKVKTGKFVERINSFKAFLPYSHKSELTSIPLNSTTVIDALECNEWTMTKDGERKRLKQHPISMSWSLGGERSSVDFPYLFGFTPALLSEPYTGNMQIGDKINVILHLLSQ